MTAEERKAWIRENSKRIYYERKAAGLCTTCGDPATDGKTRCTECRRYYSRHISLRNAERRKAGLCVWCGEPSVDGVCFCASCREKNRINSRKQTIKKEET